MASQGAKGIERLWKATNYSARGFKAAFTNEEAFRQECFLSIILIPLGLYLGKSGVERALLVGAILLVLLIELLNSALEAVVDRFGGEINELSGIAKDIGSAAVMLALINFGIVWGLVLLT